MLKLPGESSKVGASFLAISLLFLCNTTRDRDALVRIITHFSVCSTIQSLLSFPAHYVS